MQFYQNTTRKGVTDAYSPNATSICASVTKETNQPQHKINTTDPYAKKKNNKEHYKM